MYDKSKLVFFSQCYLSTDNYDISFYEYCFIDYRLDFGGELIKIENNQ